MGRYVFERHVAAPVERVYDLWTNVARMAEWTVGVTAVSDVSGPIDRAGTTYVVHFNAARNGFTVVVANRPARFVTSFSSWLLAGTIDSTFVADVNGTAMTEVIETKGVVPAIAGWLFSRGSWKGSFRGELAEFARIVERESAARVP